MNIYFQNPFMAESFIEWNGSKTFHHGFFDSHGSFLPTEVFTLQDEKGEGFAFEFIHKYVKEIFTNQHQNQ